MKTALPKTSIVALIDQLDDTLADFRTVSSALLDIEDDGVVEPIRVSFYNAIRRFQAIRDDLYRERGAWS